MTDTVSKPTAGRRPFTGPPPKQGLYDPQYEHDSCGVGFLVNMKGCKSHQIVQQALQILVNLDHRGACGCESNTGDGAGILLQTPHAFLAQVCKELKIELPGAGHYACGLIFLSPERQERADCEELFEKIITEEGQKVLGWRTVPTNNSSLGETAKASEPCIRQIFIERNSAIGDEMAFERKLYVIRKRAENAIRYSGLKGGNRFLFCFSSLLDSGF